MLGGATRRLRESGSGRAAPSGSRAEPWPSFLGIDARAASPMRHLSPSRRIKPVPQSGHSGQRSFKSCGGAGGLRETGHAASATIAGGLLLGDPAILFLKKENLMKLLAGTTRFVATPSVWFSAAAPFEVSRLHARRPTAHAAAGWPHHPV